MAFVGELGGFAENSKVIDGDFVAYNFCLAEEYLIAMGSEDWDALGDMDTYLINNVAFWLNYDGKIGEDRKNIIEKIPKGLIMTDKDRTFVDAIVAERKVGLAETFILNGNHDVRLYLTIMLFGDDVIYEGLLNYIHRNCWNVERYIKFLSDVFTCIESYFSNIDDLREQGLFLMKIKPFIKGIKFPSDYRDNAQLVQMSKFENFEWQKKYKSFIKK